MAVGAQVGAALFFQNVENLLLQVKAASGSSKEGWEGKETRLHLGLVFCPFFSIEEFHFQQNQQVSGEPTFDGFQRPKAELRARRFLKVTQENIC